MIAIVISVISVSISLFLFIKNIFETRINFGISATNFISNDVKEKLFVKISFINHSSKPLTIKSMMFLDYKKKLYSLVDTNPYQYNCDHGEDIPFVDNVEYHLMSSHKDYNTKTKTLPITVQPFSSYSGYFSFYFPAQTAHSISYKEGYIEVETSRVDIKHKRSGIDTIVGEIRNNKTRRQTYIWYHGKCITFLIFLKAKVKLLLAKFQYRIIASNHLRYLRSKRK